MFQAFRQFVPVVGRVLDTGIDEEVQHFELELLVFLDLGFVEVDDVVVADPQARGVELEFGSSSLAIRMPILHFLVMASS